MPATLMAAVLLTVLVLPMEASSPETVLRFSSLDQKHSVSGTLYLPGGNAQSCPAVVMVHGTMGINSVGTFYKGSLLRAGIAVFEVDFKTGVYWGPFTRPSQYELLAMGFAALKELRKLRSIDPSRIGIMGFSMGGHLTVNSAFEANCRTWMGNENGFAAHVAFYPVCKAFLSQADCRLTGAPMMILYGTRDAYGDGENVPLFKRMLQEKAGFEVTTVEYPGACHDFNRNGRSFHYFDPAAIGHIGYVEWNAAAADDSLTRTVDFLRRALAVK